MKRFAPIGAIAVGSLLLVGCESEEVTRIARNRHTCALMNARDITSEEAQVRIGTRNAFHYCRALIPLG
jgi:outer membrane murein-binding lipoprotein Lpp